ncbi:WD40 repeat domain-containing protein [Leptolyngbyaceae cyanobacterium CCMR0082]|uniref:WD40 repeat domain-containing protein n=1 Tax=Adonisia turfae CCMR0082 TaxID=2304604 RepID=A0A6M0SII2_9CYAN|nr:WD40 repeat domain-containing protein [Adonisia turfae]NEZ68265.1 WD40 repeat domain-containing protein [Adonisia turfae CCMR0082]
MLSLKPLVELQVHRSLSEYITALVWAPVGNRLAIASGAGEVVLWQEDFQETVLQTAGGASIDALEFSSGGQWLAAAGQAGAVMVWRLSTDSPELVETLTWGSTWIDRLQWHPHQPWLACNCGRAVYIWDADQGETLATLELPAAVQDLDWSPDGTHLAVSAQQEVYIWDTSRWSSPQYAWELMAVSRALKWSPEGAYLASANQDNSVGVLTWDNVRALKQSPNNPDDLPVLLAGLPGKIRQFAWADILDAERSPILATATRDLVVMWMLIPDEGWQSWALDLHQGTVLDVAFQPETGLLASLSDYGWILLWQAAVEPAQVLEGAKEGFSCLSWHPTGDYLAAGGQQGEVLVWTLCPDARQRLCTHPKALL